MRKFILIFILFSLIQYVYAENIEDVFDDFLRDFLRFNPETATEMGLTVQMGYNIDNGALTPITSEAVLKEYDMLESYRERLNNIDIESLPDSQRISALIMEWYIDNTVDGRDFYNHAYTINYMLGFHMSYISLMSEYHTLGSRTDINDYLRRLNAYAGKIEDAMQRIKKQKESGILPHKMLIERHRKQIEEFTALPADSNILYTRIRDLNDISGVDKNDLNAYASKALSILSDSIYPAYDEYIDFLKSMEGQADYKAGVWKLPQGDKYYAQCLKHHTTTDMSADEIHQLGLDEVKRIQGEIIKKMQTLGFEGKDFMDITGQYWDDTWNNHPEFFFADEENSKQKVLNAYQSIIDSTYKRMESLFINIPDIYVHAKHIPEYKKSGAGAYYQPASIDESREGVFYVHPDWQPFKPGMATLTFHEAVPGHHFQFSVQNQSPYVRDYQHLFFFTGYAEGWALYAEKLGYESGWHRSAYDEIEYLYSELFRAARLVIDTGLHSKRWTRKEALDYMEATLGWKSEGEIDRYCIWPGQACAYKIGEITILQLRQKAMDALGDKFDLAAFHDEILKYGSVPLSLLETIVDDYIDNNI